MSSMRDRLDFEVCTQDFFKFKGLEFFLVVDLTFLLRGGRAPDIFAVGGGATSAEGRGDRVFVIIIFEDAVKGWFYM